MKKKNANIRDNEEAMEPGMEQDGVQHGECCDECRDHCRRQFWTSVINAIVKVGTAVLAALGICSFNSND